jgi:hypothetical protein
VSCRSGGGRGPRSRCSIERRPRPLRRPGILQAFPKFRLFSASFSKQSFGRCLGFQGVAIEANRKSHFPNFLSSPPARRARRAPPNRYLIFRFSERKNPHRRFRGLRPRGAAGRSPSAGKPSEPCSGTAAAPSDDSIRTAPSSNLTAPVETFIPGSLDALRTHSTVLGDCVWVAALKSKPSGTATPCRIAVDARSGACIDAPTVTGILSATPPDLRNRIQFRGSRAS